MPSIESKTSRIYRAAFQEDTMMPASPLAPAPCCDGARLGRLQKGGQGWRALYRGSGAVAIIGAARTTFLAGRHPLEAGLRVLACTKSNLGAPPPTLGYRIVSGGKGEPIIHWAGAVPVTADELVQAPARQRGDAVQEAVEFLADHLADGPCPAAELDRRARAVGISERTLHRAKSQLHIVSEQRVTTPSPPSGASSTATASSG